MRNFFDFIVSFWDITEYALANWFILGLVAPIAFDLAFKFTREVAFILGYNSTAMKIIHWIIRFFIYIILVNIFKGLIWFISQFLIFFDIEKERVIAAQIASILILCLAIMVKAKSKINHKIFWK